MHYTAQNLLIRARAADEAGVFASVSSEQAGWDYLNMAARRLKPGDSWAADTGEHEYAHVILGGTGHVRTSRGDFLNVGERADVFSGMPSAVYLPRHTQFEIEALTDGFEVASCWVETDQDHVPRAVRPADCQIELRGGGNASRQINSIIPPGFPCHRIVAVEAYTPGGNWSSYPPHKHDTHRTDEQGKVLEADLEEIYFYKLDRPSGYAYQRIYTADRRIDAVVVAQSDDIVLVPEGYHPVVSAHGYTTYYLNFLAGSAQSLANSDDPEHAWIKQTWNDKDPRLPIVRHSGSLP